MDMRALAFARLRHHSVSVLLINYLTADDDLVRALNGMRRILRTDGLLVVDTFVPRPVVEHADFRLD
jgi:hypothetical protein